jgi:hypothetical protein
MGVNEKHCLIRNHSVDQLLWARLSESSVHKRQCWQAGKLGSRPSETI